MENVAVLDRVCVALSDPTRRAVIHRLGQGPASVSELAEPFPITLPSFIKHVRMLEESGLITTAKSGRVRTCTLRPERLETLADWLATERDVWRGRTDRLEAIVTDHQEPRS